MEVKYEESYGVSREKWCDNMKNSGFSISRYELEERLDVSRNWVNTILNPVIPFIKIPHHIAKECADKSICYYHEESLREWIFENATFTVQSELYSVEEYASKIASNDKTFPPVREGDRWVFGNDVLEEVGAPEYVRKVNERKRSQYPHIPVEPIDIFKGQYRLHIASRYSVTEPLYRRAILCGWIKCTIGDKKTIFLEDLNRELQPDGKWIIAIPKRV